MALRRSSLVLVTAAIVLCGCERETPFVDASTTGGSSTASAAVETPEQPGRTTTLPAENRPLIGKGHVDFGRGLKPFRGVVQILPEGSLDVEFEPAEMEFGVLAPAAKATGTTRIWNVGTEPLRIVKSITSCGCTAAENLAGRVIQPGSYTEFSTTMSMKSGLGEKKEKITIYFAGATERVAIQYYTAEVSLPVRLTPPHLSASRYANGQWHHTLTGEVVVSSVDGEPFRILATHGRPPEFVGFDPQRDEPRSEYTVKWDLGIFGDGVIPWFWVIETDHPDCPVIDARIQHSKTLPTRPQGRPWVPSDQRILVGEVRAEEPFEVSTKIEFNGGYAPDQSRVGVRSESPDFTAELLEIQVDGAYLLYRVRLTPSWSVEPGLFYGILAVSASGFDAPIHIIGRVVE